MLEPYPALPGLKIAHESDWDGLTGCTVIVAPEGMVASVDVRGGASGTIELDTLSPSHLTPLAHAIVLAGGSAYGLEASCGVRRALEKAGIGFPVREIRVPIVAGAILYDLAIGNPKARPDREMGEKAAQDALAANSNATIAEGSVGAGTGATCGKINGLDRAMKGGIGHGAVSLGGPHKGVEVRALVAVNAFGDVMEADGVHVLAGARDRKSGEEFAGTEKLLLGQGYQAGLLGTNTTIGVVMTNAQLTKTGAKKVAEIAQAGLLRRIRPAHTTVDGDALFCVSTNRAPTVDLNALGVAAAEAVSLAIDRAVRLAKGMGGVPGLSDA
ncbi:MAG: P1 family peptidase [Bryobacter sp.]|nr:P1 family peptidase [Bryobacter sp.]